MYALDFHRPICLISSSGLTTFIFSTIFPQRSWRYSSNCIAMENARKRVNRAIRTFFQYNSANVVTHPDLEDCHTSLFKDGVHLSFLGNDIYQLLCVNTNRLCYATSN
jgi:hypothetical protein